MNDVNLTLTMLAAVLISNSLVKMIPLAVPAPLVQISLGFMIAGWFNHGMTLNPDLFFYLFLPPLLFLDGWRISKESLIRDRIGILVLAFVLVFMTVFGLGHLLHWLIPAMPLPVAFALAAIVSPTDPVAVSAITRRVPLPPRLKAILEGESLFNDASGLVAFRLAVALAMGGSFSMASAGRNFLWLTLAGLAAGVLVTRGLLLLRNAFVRRWGEEPGAEILFSLLLPFAAYFLAEQLEASGILAAVAAGVAMSYAELSGNALAATRTQRKAVWDTLQLSLNGLMFVLLGEQLPAIFRGAVQVVKETGHHNPAWLLVYAVAICVALVLLRFLCVYGYLWLRRGLSLLGANHDTGQANPRLVLVLSVAGVRGAVTLAGVMTLPLQLPDGSPFPARDLAIFLASVVIIVSLLMASLSLPPLMKKVKLPELHRRQGQEELADQAARQACVQSVAHTLNELIEQNPDVPGERYAAMANRVLASLNQDRDDGKAAGDPAEQDLEKRMQMQAIAAARNAVFALARQHQISDEIAREKVRLLDLIEVRMS
ncbi:MAG: Na+/H+ antiporter [Alcaligenes sp.]